MSIKLAIPEGRRKLARVIRSAGDIVHIADAKLALGVDRSSAAKLLSRWASQGWLRRVGPGAYAPVSLDSLASELVLEDPWVLVPALYGPSYIGGRTAAEHWGLTEQIFRDTVVLTTRPVRARVQQRAGAIFTLRHIQTEFDVWNQKHLARKDANRDIGYSSDDCRHARRSSIGQWHSTC